jgi:hypothetical protein
VKPGTELINRIRWLISNKYTSPLTLTFPARGSRKAAQPETRREPRPPTSGPTPAATSAATSRPPPETTTGSELVVYTGSGAEEARYTALGTSSPIAPLPLFFF